MKRRTAFSYRSIPHPWKSKSIGLVADWMKPQSDQPYSEHSAWSSTRARKAGSRSPPAQLATSSSTCSAVRSHSVAVLPSSKAGSLLPEYS